MKKGERIQNEGDENKPPKNKKRDLIFWSPFWIVRNRCNEMVERIFITRLQAQCYIENN